jgi:hypothetical protein
MSLPSGKTGIMRRTHSWLVAGALLLTPGLAFAEDAKPYPDCSREPSDSDVAAAKGAFQAGQGSFNESDYPRAITYWEDAYRRDCTADALLLNLARAYELNNQKKQAVVALETYLARKPDARDRGSIQRRIEVLQAAIQSEPAQTAPAPTEQTAPPPPAPVDTGPAPEPEPQGKKPIVPLIVAGAGGAIAIAGAILYFNAAGDVDDFEKQCPGRQCPPGVDPGLVDDANSARTRMNIFGAVAIGGLAIAAGGVVWYVMSPREAPAAAQRSKPLVAPAVGPGFAGLAVSGAF